MKAIIPFVAGAILALGAGWAGFPRVIYTSRQQPVDFSHQVHADKAGSKCEDCHALRGDGSFSGIPTLDKCAGCHAAAMGTTAAEKYFIEQYVTPQREPQWASYARQPENVFFSHAAHVKLAQLKCETCHGNLGSTGKLPVYQEDRISGYSRDIWGHDGRPGMTMDDCVKCHRQKNLEHSCLDCHK
jgi:menaquinone reductase, multiheme cytochrome c subunit